MEIRQLEYFVTSVEEKGFLKASEKLFTTQPNISKSIAKLEKEVGTPLLIRTGKGVRLTKDGEKFYHYAKNTLQQIYVMKNISKGNLETHLSICSFPSNMIARTLVDIYKEKNENSRMEYHEGTVQEIIDWVSTGVCELGVVYFAQNQSDMFNHIVSHSDLEFVNLSKHKLCVYVGKNNPLYNKDTISVQELSNLKFVRGVREFFSVEHHFAQVNLNVFNSSNFDDIILTNSDHLVIDLLEQTDICYLGIDFVNNKYTQYDTKSIKIENSENFLSLGYLKHKSSTLSEEGEHFIEKLKELI